MLTHNSTPRMTRDQFVRGTVALSIALFALVVMSQASFIVSRIPQTAAVIASVLVEITNTDRSAQGLATLTINPVLNEVAQAKANDMAEKGYFAHVSPDGLTPWHWFNERGYRFSYAGENLAVDFYESADVSRAWMNSPSHRANIVGTQFTEIGIATAEGMYQGRPTTFVVQVFGTPIPERVRTHEVRDVTPSPPAEEPALATALSTTTDPVARDVLGDSAGSYLATQPDVPWWFKLIRRLVGT